MARLNGNGQAVYGRVTLSIDKVAVYPNLTIGSQPEWVSDTLAIYQANRADGDHPNGRWHIEGYDTDRAMWRELDPGAGALVAGGGGVWAVRSSAGIRSNRYDAMPYAGLRGVGVDGTLGFSRLYATGRGLVHRRLNGDEIEVAADQAIASAHVFSYGIGVYTTGDGKLHGMGIPDPVTVVGYISDPRLVRVEDGWWVIYNCGDFCYLQPIEEAKGYVLSTNGTTFSPDAVSFRPGVIRCAWNITQGEGTLSLRTRDVRIFEEARQVLQPTVWPPVPPAPRPMWMGYFYQDSVRYGSNPTAPGNYTIIVESGLQPTKPVIVARRDDRGNSLIAEYADRWDRVIAIYVADEGSTIGGIENEAQAAVAAMKALNLPRRPIVGYTSRYLKFVPTVDWQAVECYPDHGESIEAARVRWTGQVEACGKAGKRVLLTCCAYDRRPKTLTEEEMARAQPIYVSIGWKYAHVVGLALFSDGRPGGTRDHEFLRPYHQAIADAIHVHPPIEAQPPRVTITTWEPKAGPAPLAVRAVATIAGTARSLIWRYRLQGDPAWNIAVTNPATDLDHTFRFLGPGVYSIGVDVTDQNGKVVDGTAMDRWVTVT